MATTTDMQYALTQQAYIASEIARLQQAIASSTYQHTAKQAAISPRKIASTAAPAPSSTSPPETPSRDDTSSSSHAQSHPLPPSTSTPATSPPTNSSPRSTPRKPQRARASTSARRLTHQRTELDRLFAHHAHLRRQITFLAALHMHNAASWQGQVHHLQNGVQHQLPALADARGLTWWGISEEREIHGDVGTGRGGGDDAVAVAVAIADTDAAEVAVPLCGSGNYGRVEYVGYGILSARRRRSLDS